MSARRSTRLPRACSGDIYAAVPSSTPVRVAAALSVGEFCDSPSVVSPSNAFAKPKSSSLTWLSGVSFTFEGFRSR